MAGAGRFFEDFIVGDVIRHATPRTVTVGDVALYPGALRQPLRGAVVRRIRAGGRLSQKPGRRPDHVPRRVRQDRAGRLAQRLRQSRLRVGRSSCGAVYPGDTLVSTSEVIGVRPTSKGDAGVVWVKTSGKRADGSPVLEYVRWVLVRVEGGRPIQETVVPDLPKVVDPAELGGACPQHRSSRLGRRRGRQRAALRRLSGRREDRPCRRHDGGGGRAPTRDPALAEHRPRPFRRLRPEVEQDRPAAGLWRPRHQPRALASASTGSKTPSMSPASTAAATSRRSSRATRSTPGREILDKQPLPGRDDVGALRVRMTGLKDYSPTDFPRKGEDGKDHPAVVLDLDLWLLIPR